MLILKIAAVVFLFGATAKAILVLLSAAAYSARNLVQDELHCRTDGVADTDFLRLLWWRAFNIRRFTAFVNAVSEGRTAHAAFLKAKEHHHAS